MMIVVSVDSPRGRTTLAVPNDVPVERLLQEVVEACRSELDGTRWSLRARGSEAELPPERTLDQCGLYQGAVLELTAEGAPARRSRRRPAASWAEVIRYHGGRRLRGRRQASR